MKILVINPNTTASFTESVRETVNRYKAQGTEVDVTNPDTGPGTIESTFEELLSSAPTLEIVLKNRDKYDGFLIACYGNEPVTHAARELTDKPVLSITEGSYYMAIMLGTKFSIVTTGDRWKPLLWDTIRGVGLEERCASVRTISMPTHELEEAGDEAVYKYLLKESQKAIDEDGAEVICLGCAGMTGFDTRLEKELKVPVVDGVLSGLKLLEAIIGSGKKISKIGAYMPLEPIDSSKLPEVFKSAYLS